MSIFQKCDLVMFLLLVFSSTCYMVSASMDQGPSKYAYNSDEHSILNRYYNSVMNPVTQNNFSYIDTSENMLRIPIMNKFYEENKSTKKTVKKSPKSTIQKIIKKNKVRTKKLYFVSTKPTPPPNIEHDKNNIIYDREETKWKDESPTTLPSQKKKLKRWNHKFARYPMPFHKMQNRKDYHVKRSKRSEERKDIFLLKDLDEVEFLGKENGGDVVKTHIKKYWEIN